MSRTAPAAAAALAIAGVIAVTIWQLHPSLLFANTTTTGGDTGAHVLLPDYLRSVLLPHGHLTGWDPAWYDGFPIFSFYFVLPDLIAAVGGWLIPANVAFKLVTVAGSVTLPIAVWACGRLFRLRPPVPGVLAAATLPFLFEYSFTIYGGNLFSTLAGEYAYSLSLSLAVLFVGLVGRGLRTGRGRGWTAVVLAACIAAHIVPAMFAIVAALVLTAFELLPTRFRLRDGTIGVAPASEAGGVGALTRRQAAWWSTSTIGIGLLLSSWWLVPFVADQSYATSMGYQNVSTYAAILFPHADLWALIGAGAATVAALWLRSRFGILVAVMAGVTALVLVADPQGSLYNVRVLPFWFLCVYLLVGWGFGVGVAALARWWQRARQARWAGSARRLGAPSRAVRRPGAPRWSPGAVAGPLLALLGALVVVVPPFVLPASALPVHVGANEVSAWATWNYTGYQGKPAYPEYRGLISTMASLGRRYGCGPAMWEYNVDLNRFGTPESLMLLPDWTNGCIGSMEGLLFESSATTPYHFIDQAELSAQPSEAMRGLPYSAVDVAAGVQHLQLLGVKYFMASSPQVQQQALADPSLRLLTTSGPWKSYYGAQLITTTWDIFEVRDSPKVVPLANDPAVLTGVHARQSSWLGPSVAWYDDPTRANVELAQSGPANWPRVPVADPVPAPVHPVSATTVSDVRQQDQSISFHVSRIGTPVLVKISYFPNWHATGASGPWRVTPNLMVVVPTSHQVSLTYGATTADHVGTLATLLGVVGLVVVGVMGVRRRRLRA